MLGRKGKEAQPDRVKESGKASSTGTLNRVASFCGPTAVNEKARLADDAIRIGSFFLGHPSALFSLSSVDSVNEARRETTSFRYNECKSKQGGKSPVARIKFETSLRITSPIASL